VLETLPGRPISGERLVRPDGTILLGFYGDVHVRGLTVKQAKVKIIKHLRKYMTDSTLGLLEEYPLDSSPSNNNPKTLPVPPDSGEGVFKLPPERPEQPKGVSIPASTIPARAKIRVVSNTRGQGSTEDPRRPDAPSTYFDRKSPGGEREPDDSKRPPAVEEPSAPPEESVKPTEVRLDDDAEITIRINIKKGTASIAPTPSVLPAPMTEGGDEGERTLQPVPPGDSDLVFNEGEWTSQPIPPDESGSVFIDVTAYNSKTYFVLGDVAAPGKIPSTGNETVLDALQYAGGLLNTADRKNIRLVRPGRDGKTGKVYKVDLEGIEERGETATNYQVFPRDRIVVGRDAVVKKTAQIDRTYATIQSVLRSILQTASTVRSVKQAVPDQPDVVIRNLVEFWIRELNRPEGAAFDEQILREAVLRSLDIKADAPKAEK